MTIFALADCNNFYVSCERVFNPKLQGKPVVILSNNDGCFISRSEEAKALGIPMGAPYFKHKKLCTDHNVTVLSSNYQLYGDMSARVMTIFKELVPEVEVYSIDEAFLALSNLPPETDLSQYAQVINHKVGKGAGIPISIGIGQTKTLAKIANLMAKKHSSGVFDIRDPKVQAKALANLKVEDIWGVGKNIAITLKTLGITTAAELRDSDPKLIRKALGVIGERMVSELNGIACLDLDTTPQARKNIVCSRSFSRPVTELSEIEEAIADYAARAAEKMRAQNTKTQEISVLIQTYYHRDKDGFYQNSKSYPFEVATDNTSLIITKAKELLKDLYKPNLQYKKVGICLIELGDKAYKQETLFSFQASNQKSTKQATLLMQTIDQLNQRMGKGTLSFAAQGFTKDWSMKSGLKSPHYTTDWDEILKVR